MLRYVVGGLCIAISIFLFARHLSIAHFLTASAGDTIFDNIYINDVAVGGLSPEDAMSALQSASGLEQKVIGFVFNDSLVYSLTFTDFGAEYDFRLMAGEAFSYGRTGSRRERYAKLRALENAPHKIVGEALYRYDETLVHERLEDVRMQTSILPVNAAMRLDNGRFAITEGTPGRTPDIQAAADELRKILASRESGRIPLKMHRIPPTYTTEHFSAAQSLLGAFSTVYFGGEEIPRSINIRLAASLINNTVIYPGDVFSTRSAVGPGTPEQGYARAAVIVDGRLMEDYGGGLCQVASTLYNAVLYAELPIIERANHSMKVQYLDAGFDAAIAGDYMDLKFKNNSGYPILLAANARDGEIVIHIYGRETRPPNRTLAFVSELAEVIPPEPERVLIDENLPSGLVLVSTEPQDGYKYELFRIVFIDGEQVERKRVNTSVYRPIQGVITRGKGQGPE